MSFLSASEGSFSSYFLQHSRRAPLPLLAYPRPPPRDNYQRRLGHVRPASNTSTTGIAAQTNASNQLRTGLTRTLVSAESCRAHNAPHDTIHEQRRRRLVTRPRPVRAFSTFAFDEWVPRVAERGSRQDKADSAQHIQQVSQTDDWPLPPTEQQRQEALRMLDDCFLRPPIVEEPPPFDDPDDRIGVGSLSHGSVETVHAAQLERGATAREAFYTPSYIRDAADKARHLLGLVRGEYSTVSHEEIFDAYLAIPEPRPLRLSDKVRRRLLGHLSIVRQKSEASLMRFLTVIGEFRAAGIEVGVREWSTAINLTARAFRPISASSVDSALQLWREMETDAGIPGNMVTFNILFDVAAKAGKFVLAQTILREMEHRKLDFDLISHTSRIYYEGLRRSSKGVYAAYDALVEAGEVVDTTVISALIAALIKCGDPAAAERVFDRAKQWHADHEGGPLPLPKETWAQRRRQARMFVQTKGRRSRRPPVSAPLAPGYHAYRELVGYYAIAAGNVDRALGLVDEMVLLYKMRVGGQIYMRLLHGFAKHGGSRYSSWTPDLLEQVFEHLISGVRKDVKASTNSRNDHQTEQSQSLPPGDKDIEGDHPQLASSVAEEERLYIGDSLLILCVKAFLRCTSVERAQEVCLILSSFVKPNEELNTRIDDLLEAKEAEDDAAIDQRNDALE